MGDVVAQRPTGRHLACLPAVHRERPNELVEQRVDRADVGDEPGMVGRPRIGDEWIAVDLSIAKSSAHGSMTPRSSS